MSSSIEPRVLIIDLGDVVFHHNASKLTAFPPKVLGQIIRSPTWNEHEKGGVDENEALEALSTELGIDATTLCRGLDECRTTLHVDTELLIQLKKLKEMMGSKLKVYAMSNVSVEDYQLMAITLDDWSIFDKVFTSHEAKSRKPELEFYEKVRNGIGSTSSDITFVDDNIDNVIAARALGLRGILYEPKVGREALIQKLYNLFFDPLERAQEYMRKNAGKHFTNIEDGPTFSDAFSQFLIHDIMQDSSLLTFAADPSQRDAKKDAGTILELETTARRWNYFLGDPVGTTSKFPEDVDTTSYSLLAFTPSNLDSVHKVIDAIVNNTNGDGMVQTYWDPQRPRVDPVVLTNVLRVCHKYQYGGSNGQLEMSQRFVLRTLENRGYIDGTLHYYSPESFLFFVSHLFAARGHNGNFEEARDQLALRLRERVGRKDDSLATAMRILACQKIGVWCEPDIEYLKTMQQVDGGFENGWVCRYGRTRKRIGNRGVVTAYAIQALTNEAEATGRD
ncbi:HAD-like protein [Periconia macrospinosa]|uniref:HAD-like protein n=1 Tax=Periconia macrospinosa TaxID=97972 RepID=A0A2V1ECS9_9PLEO|nr:HAD-like protein [Periconia macrospinosa]